MNKDEMLVELKQIQNNLNLENKEDIIRYSVCENIKKISL